MNGVSVTRSTNTVTDLIDGYEIKLNSVTSSAATVTSNTDKSVAYSKIKEFVDSYNAISSTISELTSNGINGEGRGVLARDLTMQSIQRSLRSIITSELPGFGENSRYFSELGVKTMRDGSISLDEDDFNTAFENEPLLFDIAVNSLATSDNALVKVSHISSVLIPTAGSYNFVQGENGDDSTLNGVALSEATLADGTKQYTSISGDTKGLKLTVNGSISSATVFYGQSLADKLSDYIENVISATGDLEKSKTRATTSISDFNKIKLILKRGLSN